MSDGTYRDDQEAALERADALEQENEQLREKIEELEHPKKKKAKPPQPPKQRMLSIVAIALIASTASIAVSQCVKSHRKGGSEGKLWSALTDAGGIMRDGLVRFAWETYDADAADPRKPNAPTVDFSESPLTKLDLRELDTLLADDAYAPIYDGILAWQSAVAKYEAPRQAIADYYLHRDWHDDNYASAPQLWANLRDAASRAHAAADAIRERFLATNHAELRRIQQTWDQGSERWWYAECGILLQLAADDYRMGDASKFEAEMNAFDAAVKQAPLNVRRATRDRTHKLEKPFGNELFKAMRSLP